MKPPTYTATGRPRRYGVPIGLVWLLLVVGAWGLLLTLVLAGITLERLL